MKIYIGSYTQKLSEEIVGQGKGILCYAVDRENIKLLSTTFQRNPAYFTLSENGRYLYSAEELFSEEDPKIHAYKVNDEGGLILINSHELPGSLACHLTIHKNCLLVANYGTGDVLVFPLDTSGALLPQSHAVHHHGTGPNTVRQEGPHAHMICVVHDDLIYVPDLGIDTCKAYTLNPSCKLEPVPDWDLRVEPGSGPRHMVAHPTVPLVFVFCELTGDVYTFELAGDRPALLQKINSLPESWQDTPSSAAIRLHPNGRFLYVSNRGCDTITQFELTTEGNLKLVAIEEIKDKTPRDFAIDAKGELMAVGGMDSHTLSLYRLDKNTGRMTPGPIIDGVFSPSCICWADGG